MEIKKVLLLILFCCGWQHFASGQTKANQYWLFLTHTQKLSSRIDLLADVQSRSEHALVNVNTLLLRTALAYHINKSHSLALGYAYKGDWLEEDEYEFEHRIYQQYQYEFKIKRIEFQLRGRLEERFLTDAETKFGLRARGFAAAQFPLKANDDFSKGLFAGVQNEIFLNILNKENVNNHFFDQNRPYVSIGYRFSKKVDATVDYGLMTDQGYDERDLVSVFRLSLTTNF